MEGGPWVRREFRPGAQLVGGGGARFRLPFGVMTRRGGERPPGPLAPVEGAEPGEAHERAVIEEDPRVQIGPAPAPLERHAFTQRVDVAVHRMGERLGADVHRHHTAPELRWDLAYQPLDKRTELIQPHGPATPGWNAACGMRNRSPPFHSALRTPHSALTPQALRQILGEPVGGDANLFERVPVPHGHATVLRGLAVDGDAERRAGLVLATVAATDRAAVVVERVVVLA